MLFPSGFCIILSITSAGVMELVDVVDSKSTAGDSVPVRVRPPAPPENTRFSGIQKAGYFPVFRPVLSSVLSWFSPKSRAAAGFQRLTRTPGWMARTPFSFTAEVLFAAPTSTEAVPEAGLPYVLYGSYCWKNPPLFPTVRFSSSCRNFNRGFCGRRGGERQRAGRGFL